MTLAKQNALFVPAVIKLVAQFHLRIMLEFIRYIPRLHKYKNLNQYSVVKHSPFTLVCGEFRPGSPNKTCDSPQFPDSYTISFVWDHKQLLHYGSRKINNYCTSTLQSGEQIRTYALKNIRTKLKRSSQKNQTEIRDLKSSLNLLDVYVV